jgi:hypothetical protein
MRITDGTMRIGEQLRFKRNDAEKVSRTKRVIRFSKDPTGFSKSAPIVAGHHTVAGSLQTLQFTVIQAYLTKKHCVPVDSAKRRHVDTMLTPSPLSILSGWLHLIE